MSVSYHLSKNVQRVELCTATPKPLFEQGACFSGCFHWGILTGQVVTLRLEKSR